MNADRGLSIKERILWIFITLSKYIGSLFIRRDIQIVRNIALDNQVIKDLSSPTRAYTENIIYNFIPWKKLRQKLGEIYICEFGCGNLRYLQSYNKLLGKGNFKYIGIEAPGYKLSKEAKFFLDHNIKFINYDLNNGVPEEIKKCNVFLSFSVLEHIDNIQKFTEKYSVSAMVGSYHYHSLPTFLSVFNYLWHGCRHFNKLELKDLLKYFNLEKPKIIFYGGLFSLFFHSIFITSIDIISKFFKINYKTKKFSYCCARQLVETFQYPDNFTAKLGIHTFCFLFWKKK